MESLPKNVKLFLSQNILESETPARIPGEKILREALPRLRMEEIPVIGDTLLKNF